VRVAAKAKFGHANESDSVLDEQVRVKLCASLTFDENKKVASTPCWTLCFGSSLSTKIVTAISRCRQCESLLGHMPHPRTQPMHMQQSPVPQIWNVRKLAEMFPGYEYLPWVCMV
jgi:hypothetical protein